MRFGKESLLGDKTTFAFRRLPFSRQAGCQVIENARRRQLIHRAQFLPFEAVKFLASHFPVANPSFDFFALPVGHA